MEKSKTVIRLFVEKEGACADIKEEYDLDELGGTVLAVGDLIVDRGCGKEGIEAIQPITRSTR